MNVQILESGKEDLRDGRLFYERQGGRWLGSYFFMVVLVSVGGVLYFTPSLTADCISNMSPIGLFAPSGGEMTTATTTRYHACRRDGGGTVVLR